MKSRTLYSNEFTRNLALWMLVTALGPSTTSKASSPTIEWIRQFGTSVGEFGEVSADGLGNVYISGSTRGSLWGPNAGWWDAYIAKYDASGNLLWTEQLGTSLGDYVTDVSADGLDNVYISGVTGGSLGGPNAGGDAELNDVFIAKYDASGNFLWAQQLGSGETDQGSRISADGLGNVYISGRTEGSLGGPNAGEEDAFIAKYDASGNLLWIEQFGTSELERSGGVSADGLDNVYISGVTGGNLGGPDAGEGDAFIGKYDASGNLLWMQQLGTSEAEWLIDVSADGLGNVYMSGRTAGSLGGPNAGDRDAFIAKYNPSGDLLWTEQLGSSEYEDVMAVSADGLGNVYISGRTTGNLGGVNAGERDAYIAKYDESGNLLWGEQFGTSDFDVGLAVTADGLGNVYMSGMTEGSLGGINAGQEDAFLVKFSESVPSVMLQPGDANQDLTFDQLDIVEVSIAAKYLTGQPATWGVGDWNGAPGGEVGSPPTGDGLFNQLDIVAAQQAGLYLTGSYASVKADSVVAVPEPTRLALAVAGLLCVFVVRRHFCLRPRIAVNLEMWLLLPCLWLGSSPTAALAVVTSAPGWDYMITAGEPLFGVSFDGVVRLRTDGVTKCNAALVSDRHLLTAAHCFDNDWDGEPNYDPDTDFTAVFEMSNGNVDIGFVAADVAMPDGWVDVGADLAVVTLPTDAPQDAPRYSVNGVSDEVGKEIVIVGHGNIGLGSTGESFFLDEKVAGRNRYEGTRDGMPSDEPLPPGGYLVYDFDSGREENNALALYGFDSDLGLGDDEAKSASGDSGAPAFIDGAIAGIVSFGGMEFDGDLLPDVDGSWGELAFDTRVSSFQPFLADATDGQIVFVPEPHSGLLLFVGLIAAAGFTRLRACARTSRSRKWVEARASVSRSRTQPTEPS